MAHFLLRLNLFLLLLSLSSCLPFQEDVGNKRKSKVTTSDASTQPANDDEGEDNFSGATTSDAQNLYWYTTAPIQGPLTLNASNSNSVYIRGKAIDSYLSEKEEYFHKSYCLVVSYNLNDSTSQKNLRARAIPDEIINTSTKRKEKFLRVEFSSLSDNQSQCKGKVAILDRLEQLLEQTELGAFQAKDICPNCQSLFSSINLALYEAGVNGIQMSKRIPIEKIDLKTLTLRVDNSNYRSNSTTSTSGNCNSSVCQGSGLHCCIDNRCVKDGTIKSSYNATDYVQALLAVRAHNSEYIHWTSVYNVCGGGLPGTVAQTNQDTTGGSTGPIQADESSQEELDKLILKYHCLEEGKKETPDFVSAGVCLPTRDDAAFKAVRADVWRTCGCKVSPISDDPEDPRCPNYGLTATKNASGQIIKVSCYVPPTLESLSGPLQQLQISLSTKSVPHRFYNGDGLEVNDLALYVQNGNQLKQEGDEFLYLDPGSKNGPIQGAFSINSIFGQMSLELNQALPAKVIAIELGLNYIITSYAGSYSPCPNCFNDKWFEIFKAFPSSQKGWGLQWVGYNTNRQLSVAGDTRGNYEDNIFGRACWVPPTMLPFAHRTNSDLQIQRTNRLKTQAAMYINGYQRDWWGFNKGAAIASFDGVSWFAIGPGRRVQNAPTNKLFLAINAPFADLADAGSISISVVQDRGGNTANNFDYDFNMRPDNTMQNTAASCQYQHQCEKDADCVTKLGWEYTCADPNALKTFWPKFDGNAQEMVGEEFSNFTFADILTGNVNNIEGKRCVYRGAGAPCKGDYLNNTDALSLTKQKIFTCAPNFYCAPVASSAFNSRLVRTVDEQDNISFGQDSNILGRPLHYLQSTDTLNPEIQANILHNGDLTAPGASDFGLCRPGKNIIEANWVNQHRAADGAPSKRTDFISQIGSCQSVQSGQARVQSCPVFDEEGNYINNQNGISADDNARAQARIEQNSCGVESVILDSAKTTCTDTVGGDFIGCLLAGDISSTFKAVEALDLRDLSELPQKSLVRNACLRRAGSVCHTNLDCSPNSIHLQESLFFDERAFGGTLAELNYWRETLICAQDTPTPHIGASNYYDFDMSKNRCCREIGQNFTMYSELSNAGVYTDEQRDEVLPESTNNPHLKVTNLSVNAPNIEGRYSRYSIVPIDLANSQIDRKIPAHSPPVIPGGSNAGGPISPTRAPKAFQWKTINDTASKMCCGGGWVRKFADGTNDWDSNISKLSTSLPATNYQCLNYSNPLYKEKLNGQSQLNYQTDLDLTCKNAANNQACIQNTILPSDGSSNIVSPKLNFTESNSSNNKELGVLDLTPTLSEEHLIFNNKLSRFVPWIPKAYRNSPPITVGGANSTECLKAQFGEDVGDSFDPIPYFSANIGCNIFSLFLPSYIGGVPEQGDIGPNQRITDISFHFFTNTGNEIPALQGSVQDGKVIDEGECAGHPSTLRNSGFPAGVVGRFCRSPRINSSAPIVLHFAANDTLRASGIPWFNGGIKITYPLFGTTSFDAVKYNVSDIDSQSPMTPANDLYYLTRLGRLELSGIPQIVYEPIYCNDNRFQLVPGIFDLSDENRAEFESNAFNYDPSINDRSLADIYREEDSDSPVVDAANPRNRVVYMDKLKIPKTFMSNQFLCCMKLGQNTTQASQCCSGHAIDINGQQQCRLPSGTDLHVYFNRFVSGDGVGDEQPGGGLLDVDFIPETGEPKMKTSVANKLVALGRAYCDNGGGTGDATLRQGALMGNFRVQPSNSKFIPPPGDEDSWQDKVDYYSISDSPSDYDATNDTGYSRYLQGHRWNHHLYCE